MHEHNLLNMEQYPLKVLVAFAESFSERSKFNDWLLKHGYPELAALSSAIRGSEPAFVWLMKNQYYHYAALDGAIDKQLKARVWLSRHEYPLLGALADAVNENKQAIAWLDANGFQVMLFIAQKIRTFRDSQVFDYHKMHF
jgi:hypothetical protein